MINWNSDKIVITRSLLESCHSSFPKMYSQFNGRILGKILVKLCLLNLRHTFNITQRLLGRVFLKLNQNSVNSLNWVNLTKSMEHRLSTTFSLNQSYWCTIFEFFLFKINLNERGIVPTAGIFFCYHFCINNLLVATFYIWKIFNLLKF